MTGLTGTIRLARVALRRDRVTLVAWVLGLTGFLAATTAMFVQSLATYADVVQETELPTNNPGLRMLGLTSGPSIGGATMVRDYVTLAVLAALMSTFAVVRHTRQNEELGRTEMVGATVVGRYAGLAAAVIVTVGANVVLAALLSLAMMANGQPTSGSLTAGAAVGAVGVASKPRGRTAVRQPGAALAEHRIADLEYLIRDLQRMGESFADLPRNDRRYVLLEAINNGATR